MNSREKYSFWGGIAFLVFLFSFATWPVLWVLAWYIRRIPDKRLPLTDLLANNQKKCYTWISDFLTAWCRRSIFLCVFGWAFFAVPVLLLWSLVNLVQVQVPLFVSLAQLGTNPLVVVLFIYLTGNGLTLLALRMTKSELWGGLFWQAEPTAKWLVGDAEYEKMSDKEKDHIKRNVVDSLIGINKATIVVSGGEMQTKSPPAGDLARFGGPGVLIVQEGHAVILERGGRISKIVGVGVHPLGAFERPSMVVPLSLRTEEVEVKNVVTQDSVIIDSIKMLIFHKADAGSKTHTNGDYPFDDEIIKKRIWSPKGGDWRGAVRSVTETATRDVFARYTLDDVMLASDEARAELNNELKAAVNRVTKDKMGVDVTTVSIGETNLPKEVKEKLRARWLAELDRQVEVLRAERERDVMIRKGEGEARALEQVEEIKSTLRESLIRQLTAPLRGPKGAMIKDAQIAMRYIDAVERLSLTIVRDDLTAMRYVEALEHLTQSEATKTVVLGEARGILDNPVNDNHT